MEDRIANKLEMAEREREIRKAIAEGKSCADLCYDLGLKFKLPARTIESQYYKIVNDVTAQLTEKRAEIALITLERQNLIYQRCMRERKYKTALDATVCIAKLAKLYDSSDIEQKMPDITVTKGDFTKPLAVVGGEDDG